MFKLRSLTNKLLENFYLSEILLNISLNFSSEHLQINGLARAKLT